MDTDIDYATLAEAITATAKTRGHEVALADCESVIDALAVSHEMAAHWARYQDRNSFAADLSWNDLLDTVRSLCDKAADIGIYYVQ